MEVGIEELKESGSAGMASQKIRHEGVEALMEWRVQGVWKLGVKEPGEGEGHGNGVEECSQERGSGE